MFVEVVVTVNSVTLSQIHPALDGRNRPLMAPNAFDINSSIQRCLVKAIALHGLGLYIYAGEDLPQPVGEAANDPEPGNAQPEQPSLKLDRRPVQRADHPERFSKAQQGQIHRLAIEVGVLLDRVLSYFGVTDLQSIPAQDFLRVMRSLANRRQAA